MQVVYCYQGHQCYMNAVEEQKLYSIHKDKMPWEAHKLCPQEVCQVTSVDYLVGPPTLCSITLEIVKSSSTSSDPVVLSFK